MADQEIRNNRVEQAEATSNESGSLSSMSIELMNSDTYKQLSQFDSNKMSQNGFPDLELIDSGNMIAKGENVAQLKSGYETGNELRGRELNQAGIDSKNVKHETKTEEDGWSSEKTSVKYPNGLEVSVEGRSKHMPSGKDVHMEPEANVKLPKGFTQDKDGVIYDRSRSRVAQVNEDGTVTVKVGKEYVTQGPAGVTEATVLSDRNPKGPVVIMKN